jgi:hypothetical protein
MISQKGNDIKRINGVINRLAKERALLNKITEKYPAESDDNLETYAARVAKAVIGSPSPFIPYKTANMGAKNA